MMVIGVDIGFGFTKATNGKDTMIFKSLLGEAMEIQFRSDFGSNSLANNLHVTVDDRPYFVGEFAEHQSNIRQFTLDQEKLITDFVKVLGLTVSGLLTESKLPINLVSGLPVAYFKQYNERFGKLLSGHHQVTFHKPDGSKNIRDIHINKVRMMPQPLGSLLNLLMNNKGKIINGELTKQKIGVIDIGFRTTDFTILDRMQYIDRGSKTIDFGISKCFSVIADKLREKSGISIELYRLYRAVEKGLIKMRGQEYNFAKIRDHVYSQSASSIADEVSRLWADDWDIDTIILTGGGSTEMAKYLKPLVTGNLVAVENNTDARLNNVIGYYKYGKNVWGNPEPQKDPPLPLP